jgi:hypothetical protein
MMQADPSLTVVHFTAPRKRMSAIPNERPRETLQFETAAERFNACVASAVEPATSNGHYLHLPERLFDPSSDLHIH